jgi:hypothetical protein
MEVARLLDSEVEVGVDEPFQAQERIGRLQRRRQVVREDGEPGADDLLENRFLVGEVPVDCSRIATCN